MDANTDITVARMTASYLAREFSGKESPGQQILHIRRGRVRYNGPSKADMSEIIKPFLSNPKFTGVAIINPGEGGIAHKENPILFVEKNQLA